MKTMIITLAATAALLLTGCGHNIHVHGVGLATPYFAFGSGDFSCVKDNVTVENTEKVKADGTLESKQKFKVSDQVTGYDVEAKEKMTLPQIPDRSEQIFDCR